MAILHDTNFSELRRILDDSLLTPVFQPIIDFRTRTILGYETLIRGPENSPLHRPDVLFAAASALELTLPLERLCRDKSLRAFARLGLGGRLFLNVTPSSLLDPQLINGHTQALLDEIGLPAHRIVLELTEQQRVTDLPDIHAVLAHYRGRGFQIAIDDLGEGFANLRMWSELQPEFVKIDKHFVHGIADDRIKYHFVRAMQDLAGICNAALVAEGIERSEDFNCLREMGIACGQGYFIARPTTQPPLMLPEHALAALDQGGQVAADERFATGEPDLLDARLAQVYNKVARDLLLWLAMHDEIDVPRLVRVIARSRHGVCHFDLRLGVLQQDALDRQRPRLWLDPRHERLNTRKSQIYTLVDGDLNHVLRTAQFNHRLRTVTRKHSQ